MWPRTSELFEFNKMWLVFGFTVFIFFLWGMKMLLQGRFKIRRTPLDIPLALFLLSQIISTIFSIDPHVSLWGYYSRFNGGLFSTISYIFLYYAFATNLIPGKDDHEHEHDTRFKPVSFRMLGVSLLAGLAVTLWGLPSHYGLDPTCLMFRGTLDTSCWTEQFQPTIRIFSTLGQPNWMGTLLAALIPLSLGFGIFKLLANPKKITQPALYLALTFLFFISLLFTLSQSSFLGAVLGLVVFFVLLFIKHGKEFKTERQKNTVFKYIILAIIIIAGTAFINGTPIESLNKFATLSGISRSLQSSNQAPKAAVNKSSEGIEGTANLQIGGTQSGNIRLIVWQGALELFKRHPIIGTGVETYAYAYYGVKPLAHNLTTEWDYLYNKAHNEYLNYLATTGILGLGSYLLIIAFFFYFGLKYLLKKDTKYFSIGAGIMGGYVAILVSNFFGFSVVPVNLLFFMFPIFLFELINPPSLHRVFAIPRHESIHSSQVGMGRMTMIVILGLFSLYMEFFLLNFWFADINYSLGSNLNKVGEFSQAYTPLNDAANMLPGEDLYKDELSINKATLAVLLAQNKDATQAAILADQARTLSDEIIARHPNNIVFYKTRIRVQYALSQLNPAFIDQAIQTALVARTLAPTDPKLAYNLALFYNQKGENDKMLQMLDEAIRLKPNYTDAYYAKALLYSQLMESDPQKASEYKQKATETLEYVLKNIEPNHTASKDLLKSL